MEDVLVLEELKDKVLKFSGTQCSYYSEACIVLLEELNHSPGVSMHIFGDYKLEYNITWDSKPIKAGWKQTNKLVENAATAIAFFLVIKLTDYTIVEEAVFKTGIDYWLGYKEDHELYDEDNFMNAR